MTDQIIHLILIQSNEQIGMDEITRRIATALSGDVIQLVPVVVPKPPVVTPPVITPAPVVVKKVRVKVGLSGWVRKLPNPTSPSVKRLRPVDGEFVVVAQQTGWVLISLGWLDESVVEYI